MISKNKMKRIGLSLTEIEYEKILEFVNAKHPGVKPATFAKMTLLSYIDNVGKFKQLDLFEEEKK